ncbi:MAG: hypothetical protein HKO85_01700 [Xanthomonadales bacterium]|nr:hypothetical protein [Gammaproteobacteria bacterium]MBT8050759.1 hypothetical protein [Gammaproteobacteria bacterium]NNJ80237.1 hypothetical protein [Xanthomonadales bacterium]NNL03973.1 hypothetical protein [Xanthomonadales bacterium]
MSILVVTWSMFSAACAMLALIHVFLWSNRKSEPVYLLLAFMALAASFVAIQEMNLFSTGDPDVAQRLILWQNLLIALVLIPMVWSVRSYLPSARTWGAVSISVLWGIGLLINFLMPGNLTFTEISAMDARVTVWGDPFYVPVGTVNDWKWLVDITVVLIPLYIIDAAWHDRRPHRGRRGLVITLGTVLFILFAGIQAIAVDAGILSAPYMVSAAFLTMVFALTWVFARDVVNARTLAVELTQSRNETEQLVRANLLGEVASALAHELNQPLAAILGNAQAARKFLSRPEPDLTEIEEILDDIVRDDKRARDIILKMRSMLHGDESVHEPVELRVIVAEAIDFLKGEFKQNGISTRFDVSPPVPMVGGGRIALQQVILNLLINAEHALLDSRSENCDIQIRLFAHHGGAVLEVRDHGPGIADEIRSRLFEPFVTTKHRNIGMGLAVCKRIIEARGGQLSAENADGGGACFRVWLPAEQA